MFTKNKNGLLNKLQKLTYSLLIVLGSTLIISPSYASNTRNVEEDYQIKDPRYIDSEWFLFSNAQCEDKLTSMTGMNNLKYVLPLEVRANGYWNWWKYMPTLEWNGWIILLDQAVYAPNGKSFTIMVAAGASGWLQEGNNAGRFQFREMGTGSYFTCDNR
ncbi:hypothetical protein [Zooshikella sp. RANM57]|uniref:hypothetical protein n=1 Tax=Zooshikella sp. RANM57 TaxID=3425863 RepID=UPI003D6EFA72